MKNYPIYKKRDGQEYKETGNIYASSFAEAKKEWAKMVANSMHNECWLTYLDKSEFDKKGFETGFYFNERLVFNENETVNTEASYIECFLSKKAIDKGLSFFNEDVYSWELRKK